MVRKFTSTCLGAAFLSITCGVAQAKVSAEEAAKLSDDPATELTSIGAEQAGNEAETIPPWTGGITPDQAPEGYEDGSTYLTPYPDDEPLFVITGANMGEHADNLTDGNKTLLERYDTYKMKVYPTRRSVVYPEPIREWTVKNATTAELIGTDTLKNAKLGFPFPIPQAAAEVIVNHKVRYRADSVKRSNDQGIVYSSGRVQYIQRVEDVLFTYGNISNPGDIEKDNMILYYVAEVIAPPKDAGKLTLVHETADQVKDPRKAWIANKGAPRARRAPNVAYDNPSDGTDGHLYNDQVDIYNGAMDRYTWKLLGKKEMYVGYNNYEANDPKYKYEDLLTPKHFNQDVIRYELHRVWVVEANLKEGVSHVFTKRVMYVDEDSWGIVQVENYDKQGELWRFQDGGGIFGYNVGASFTAPEVLYDFQNGDYFAGAMSNEGKVNQYGKKADFSESDFTTAALKRRLK